MEKSSFFQCNLMKRRYSVPETVMRKHTLQEVALRKQLSDSGFTNISPSPDLENGTDEIPQTHEASVGIQTSIEQDQKLVIASSKKSTKNKKRKCFRSLRRSTSSYCQYRYSMSAFSRKILSHRSSRPARNLFSFDNPNDSSVIENVDSILGNDVSSGGRSASTTNGDSNKTSDEESTSASKSDTQYFPKISRTLKQPRTATSDFTSGDKSERVNQVSNDSDSPSNSFDLTQNLNAINTDFPLILQSESVYVNPTRPGDSTRREKHSISIKISPFYESPHSNLKTEVRIGIDRTTTRSESTQNKTDDENEKERFKYDFMNSSQKTTHKLQSRNTLYSKYQKTRRSLLPGSSNGREKIDEGKERRIDIIEQNFPCVPIKAVKVEDDLPTETPTYCRPADIEGATSYTDREDCSVPMLESMCCSPRSKDNQPLKVEVNVGKVDSLEGALIRRNSRGTNMLSTQPSNDKYEQNTRTTLNYLFQKLGNSYHTPQKRLLLKNPTFVDYNSLSHSNSGQYYSGLPRLLDGDGSDMLYDVSPIGETLVPSVKKLDDSTHSNNELSDSDISIADSLEDSQSKSPRDEYVINKYRRYDNRPARGDVDRLVKASNMKEDKMSKVANGISYYLHFLNIESSKNEEGDKSVHQEVVDEQYVPPHIPTNLLEKLNKRSNSISKHSSCMGTTSKNREFVHKQIQTCFNARESLRRKRRQCITEPSIDRRIARILMTGLKIQEEESSSPGLSSNQIDDRPSDGEDKTIDKNYDTILREEEVEERINLFPFGHHHRLSEKSKKFRYPTTETSKGKGPICNFDQELTTRESNFSRYRYHQGKLKYFKDRKVRKRREGEIGASSDNTDNVKIPSAVPVIHRSACNGEKKDIRVKNGRHKAKIFRGVRRFCQKFEAIPEEMANSFNEKHNIETNKFTIEDDKANDREEISSSTDQKKAPIPTEICDKKIETNEQKQEINSETDCEKKDVQGGSEIKLENTEDAEVPDTRDSKSQKRGDLLYNSDVKEELITLSKGWINFYLLKATNVVPDGAPNQIEEAEKDENIAHLFLPQQYMLHIQATPQHQETNLSLSMKQPKRISPELRLESPPLQRHLSSESKWYNISSKSQSSLPGKPIEDTKISSSNSDVDMVSSVSCVNHCNGNLSPSTATVMTDQAENNFSSSTKLGTSTNIEEVCPRSTQKTENLKILGCDLERHSTVMKAQSEIGQTAETTSPTPWLEARQTSTSTTESAATDLNTRSTTSQSTSTTSSNCSISSANREVELSVLRTNTAMVEENYSTDNTRKHKKTQHDQLPQNYHDSSRQQGYRRSLSVDGNRKTVNKKNSSSMVDIEMRLLVKNHCYENDIENRSHSWKFTLSSEDSSGNNRHERSSKTRSTHSMSNQNSHYQNQNHIVRLSACSENSSTSTTSSCSFSEKRQIKERKLTATSELNTYPLRPKNKLTVTGSSITPESKPKPPTMSEKDITRTRLSRHATNNHR